MFSRKKNDTIDNAVAATEGDPSKKLGLSKTVYAFGLSARDALLTFAGATAAIFPVMYFGQGKSKAIDTIAKAPETLRNKWHDVLGKEAGKAGDALAVSAALAFLVSHFANIPGLFRGPKIVQQAEDKYNAEIEDNIRLSKENKQLTQELQSKTLALSELQATIPQESTQMGETSEAVGRTPLGFASRLGAPSSLSNSDKLLAQRNIPEGSHSLSV